MSHTNQPIRVRKLKIFIPSSETPLLTPYGKTLLPKLSPLKQKYQIQNTSRQQPNLSNPELQYLNAKDIDKLNRSYEAYQKAKGTDIRYILKQSQYRLDPLYRSMLNSKNYAEKYRANSERKCFGSTFTNSFSSKDRSLSKF